MKTFIKIISVGDSGLPFDYVNQKFELIKISPEKYYLKQGGWCYHHEAIIINNEPENGYYKWITKIESRNKKDDFNELLNIELTNCNNCTFKNTQVCQLCNQNNYSHFKEKSIYD
jgi:hypothetical protein